MMNRRTAGHGGVIQQAIDDGRSVTIMTYAIETG
jgi:hypothetical protein